MIYKSYIFQKVKEHKQIDCSLIKKIYKGYNIQNYLILPPLLSHKRVSYNCVWNDVLTDWPTSNVNREMTK